MTPIGNRRHGAGNRFGFRLDRRLSTGMGARRRLLRINHEEAYSDGTACTNNAESFFSRLRRAEIGQHHHMDGAYLNSYAHEAA